MMWGRRGERTTRIERRKMTVREDDEDGTRDEKQLKRKMPRKE
jgi:hypothetical protein